MLSLTRNKDQRIIITLEDGRTIEVAVGNIGQGRVKLNIDAPATILVDRGEVWERKVNEDKAA